MNPPFRAPRGARSTALWRSRLVPWLAALFVGLAVGVGVAKLTLLLAAAVMVVGGVTVLALLRWPELAPSLFWFAFSMQSTVFFGFGVTGLYYPLYLLMVANVVLALGFGRLEVHRRLLPYALFLVVVLAGLLPIIPGLSANGYQRLFIYFMGFLVYFQFPTNRIPMMLIRAQVLSMLVIATWVIVSSIQGGFGPRGSIHIDQNIVSLLLGFGIVALLAQLMGRRLRLFVAILAWLGVGYGMYAMLLLASRGMSIGIAVVAVIMFGRIFTNARRSVPILVAALLAGLILFNLPGSDNLFLRFQSSDVTNANDRVPLWRATVQSITTSSVPAILMGHGFESSMSLIRSVRAVLSSTHNAYLQMLYEFGLVGFAGFLWMHLLLLASFWRRRSPSALYGAGLTVFLLMADLTVTAPDGFLYWVALGHLIAMSVAVDRVEGEPVAIDDPGT